MTSHVPADPAGGVSRHVLRNALLVVGAAALLAILFTAAFAARPVKAPSTPPSAGMVSLVEVGASSRAG